MEDQTGPARDKGLVQWAITPPQSYAVYLVALFLVAGLSFYVGTLKSKKAIGIAAPTADHLRRAIDPGNGRP